jgi:hypothetical protein
MSGLIRGQHEVVHVFDLFTFRERCIFVNMEAQNTIRFALENLERSQHIHATFHNGTAKNLDGKVTFDLDGKRFTFNTEVKKEIRPHHLEVILEMAKQHEPFMIVAEQIYPKIKEELREKRIAYLETSGNLFIHRDGCLIRIEGQKLTKPKEEKGNRAFTKAGLKLVFQFLVEENLINRPYRIITERTWAGLGNINNVINGLKEQGFYIRKNEAKMVLTNKKELIEKWITLYEERLKPALFIGRFDFYTDQELMAWAFLNLHHGYTFWGGEAAGNLITNHLRPEELILYTSEPRNDLIKNYGLMPKENGKVAVYKKFWNLEWEHEFVPYLLAYADLMNTGDKRCIETAKMIYDQHIAPNI